MTSKSLDVFARRPGVSFCNRAQVQDALIDVPSAKESGQDAYRLALSLFGRFRARLGREARRPSSCARRRGPGLVSPHQRTSPCGGADRGIGHVPRLLLVLPDSQATARAHGPHHYTAARRVIRQSISRRDGRRPSGCSRSMTPSHSNRAILKTGSLRDFPDEPGSKISPDHAGLLDGAGRSSTR